MNCFLMDDSRSGFWSDAGVVDADAVVAVVAVEAGISGSTIPAETCKQ